MSKKVHYYKVRLKATKTADKNVSYKPAFFNLLILAHNPTEAATTAKEMVAASFDFDVKLQIRENKNLSIDAVGTSKEVKEKAKS